MKSPGSWEGEDEDEDEGVCLLLGRGGQRVFPGYSTVCGEFKSSPFMHYFTRTGL